MKRLPVLVDIGGAIAFTRSPFFHEICICVLIDKFTSYKKGYVYKLLLNYLGFESIIIEHYIRNHGPNIGPDQMAPQVDPFFCNRLKGPEKGSAFKSEGPPLNQLLPLIPSRDSPP